MAQLLGQQQLLEPSPQRRIIVPVGHDAWWGVDPSTLRVALAGVQPVPDGLERWVRTVSFASLDGPARLAHIYRETHDLVFGLAERAGETGWPTPPGIVFVEQPSGKQQNPELVYAVGVIQAAIYDALYSGLGRPVRIETCTSSWWKKRACGRGDIYKPKRGDRTPYGVLVWAQSNGYDGSSWDEADAFGIAEAARREVALDGR